MVGPCDSVEEGEALLKKLTKESEEAKKEFETKLAAFTEKWKDQLEG